MSVATKPHPEANEVSGDGDKSDAEPVKSVAVTDDSEQEVILDYALTLEGNPLNPFDALFIRAAWQKNLDAAHVESECPAITPVEFPEGYYTGSLIDTHLHMPPISDEFGGDSDNVQSDVTGVDAAFYNSIAQDDRPVLGVTVTVDQIACTLKHEGTIQAFTFFPVYQDSPSALIDLAYKSVNDTGHSLFRTSSPLTALPLASTERFCNKCWKSDQTSSQGLEKSAIHRPIPSTFRPTTRFTQVRLRLQRQTGFRCTSTPAWGITRISSGRCSRSLK